MSSRVWVIILWNFVPSMATVMSLPFWEGAINNFLCWLIVVCLCWMNSLCWLNVICFCCLAEWILKFMLTATQGAPRLPERSGQPAWVPQVLLSKVDQIDDQIDDQNAITFYFHLIVVNYHRNKGSCFWELDWWIVLSNYHFVFLVKIFWNYHWIKITKEKANCLNWP